MALIETLTDAFTTDALATKWPGGASGDFTYGATVTGGVCNVVCGDFVGSLASNDTYTSAGSYMYAKVTAAVKHTTAPIDTTCNTTFGVKDSATGDGINNVEFSIDTVANTISCLMYGASAFTDIGTALTVAYSTTTHAWLALDFRTNVRWLYSADGATWTAFARTETVPTWASLTTNRQKVEPYREPSQATFTNNATIDNWNINGTAPTAPSSGNNAAAVKTSMMQFVMD